MKENIISPHYYSVINSFTKKERKKEMCMCSSVLVCLQVHKEAEISMNNYYIIEIRSSISGLLNKQF